MATVKGENTPVNMRMQTELANKLKYIAWHDRETLTEIIHAAGLRVVKDFEKKNGEISEADLKKAKII